MPLLGLAGPCSAVVSSKAWASLAAASKLPQPLWAIVASTGSSFVSPVECCLPRAFCISCSAYAAEPCPPKSILCSFCHCNRCTRGGPWLRGRHLWANCPRLATRLGRLRPKLSSGYSLSHNLEPEPRFNLGLTWVQLGFNATQTCPQPGLNPVQPGFNLSLTWIQTNLGSTQV